MHVDMRKPRFEAYMSDIGLVIHELDNALENLNEWAAPKPVPTPLATQVARSTIHHEPLGVVLIIAPWNYPVLLLLAPLIGAIAAGNCVVLKPSEEVPATNAVIARVISAAFDPTQVLIVEGPGNEVVPAMMGAFRFDHVFFTGSTQVGRAILAQTAAALVPTTLELGGKSPAIVDRKAAVGVAAKRIAWSKYFNAGQTCIATDHALLHSSVVDEFLDHFGRFLHKAYGADPQQSPHYARSINARHHDRVSSYLRQGTAHIGGTADRTDLYVAPTVLTDVEEIAPVMQEEIFGPVLPVMTWTEPEEVVLRAQNKARPLATYIFSQDRSTQVYFRDHLVFGGGCINHCMLQFAPAELPFGGIGESGTGRSHGRHAFERFSQQKGVVQASTLIDHGLQEPPYTALKERLLRIAL